MENKKDNFGNLDNAEFKVAEKLFTEEDIKNDKNAIVANEDEPVSIANLDVLTDNIVSLLEFVRTPLMISKKHLNYDEFENIIYTRYNGLLPLKIINLLLEDEQNNAKTNLKKIIEMLEGITNVKNGTISYEKQYEIYAEKQNEEYIYSKFGGKKNFEKVLEDMKKEKENKKENK
jgi:hypothetical protein